MTEVDTEVVDRRDDHPAGHGVMPSRGLAGPVLLISQFLATAREVTVRLRLLRPGTWPIAARRIFRKVFPNNTGPP